MLAHRIWVFVLLGLCLFAVASVQAHPRWSCGACCEFACDRQPGECHHARYLDCRTHRDVEEVGTDIRFEFDKADLTEDAEAKLRHIGRTLTRRQMAYARVCLEGNADTVGTPGYNDRLSERRALAVREFMLREFPELGSGQFRVEAQGETRPIEQPERDDFRSAINRRVEIRVRAAVPSRPPPRPHCRCPRCCH